MAISTKAELKTEASSWVDDPHWFEAKADNLIVLAEARLNRLCRAVWPLWRYIAGMEKATRVTPGGPNPTVTGRSQASSVVDS